MIKKISHTADFKFSKYDIACYGLFFFTGFGQVIPSILFSLFVIFFIKKVTIGTISSFVNILLIEIFLILLFIPGLYNEQFTSELKYFLFLTFTVLVLYLSIVNNDNYKNLLFFFILGLFLKSEIIVIFSFFSDSSYGYGRLFNPFNGEDINSPSISNNLAICACYFLLINKSVNLYIGIMKYVTLSLIVLSGIYLGGRTFFVFLFVTISFLFLTQGKLKLYIIGSILITLISFGLLLLYNYNESIQNYMTVIINRFSSEGFNSPRFELLSDGFNKLTIYPLGGFYPEVISYQGNWYHNIYLDTARISGIIPVLILFFIDIYLFIKFIISKQNKNVFFLLFIVFLTMQQDVIIEGNLLIFLLYSVLSTIILKRERVV